MFVSKPRDADFGKLGSGGALSDWRALSNGRALKPSKILMYLKASKFRALYAVEFEVFIGVECSTALNLTFIAHNGSQHSRRTHWLPYTLRYTETIILLLQLYLLGYSIACACDEYYI